MTRDPDKTGKSQHTLLPFFHFDFVHQAQQSLPNNIKHKTPLRPGIFPAPSIH